MKPRPDCLSQKNSKLRDGSPGRIHRGFDKRPASIFKKQIDFIQKSGIVTAMVGLLNAPRGTRLTNG